MRTEMEATAIAKALPRYRTYREVEALKIKAIIDPNEGLELADDDADRPAVGERVLTFEDAGYEACAFLVDRVYMARHKPQVGGYYVVYDGSYQSFSPATFFEKGYTRITL